MYHVDLGAFATAPRPSRTAPRHRTAPQHTGTQAPRHPVLAILAPLTAGGSPAHAVSPRLYESPQAQNASAFSTSRSARVCDVGSCRGARVRVGGALDGSQIVCWEPAVQSNGRG